MTVTRRDFLKLAGGAALTVAATQMLPLRLLQPVNVANPLAISLHTTKSHVRNILGKLHAANRRQAARLAAQHGLLGT